MNISFHVFSGTGNTARVCRLLADRLNYSVSLFYINGDNLIMTAFGAGFVHGASYYTWAYDGAEAAIAK